MASEDSERRDAPRNGFYCPIEFFVEKNKESGILPAEVMNISDSGLRIYLGYPLCEGQEILINDRLPNGRQLYRVRWCNKIQENFFEAGLKSLQ